MKLDAPRIPPLAKEDWSESQAELLNPQAMRGDVPNVFRTIVRHEKLAKRWLVFATHILSKSSLSPRDREIAILRAGYRAGSDYEWGQHVLIGRDAGLSDDEIEAIKVGSSADVWNDVERAVLDAADELHTDVFISDATWQGLSAAYNEQQILDLIFTCGQYRMLAGALNSLGVPLDDDIKDLV